MVQNGQITFYTSPYSPFCTRVKIALEEAKAEYTSFNIDTKAKPEWYNSAVNTITGKIPALSYGGPKHPPEKPSPEATVLIESGVIVEFIAETFPSANLLPPDALLRAKARIFISVVDAKMMSALRGFFFMGAPASDLLAAFEAVQARLPPTGFAVGEWSVADISAGPFLVQIMMMLENELGKYPLGEGTKTLEALRAPKFARIMKYAEDVKARPSFQAVWDEPALLAVFKAHPAVQRD